MVTFGTLACAVAFPPSSLGSVAAVAAAGVELDVLSEPQAERANTMAPIAGTHPRFLIFMIGLLPPRKRTFKADVDRRQETKPAPVTCRTAAQRISVRRREQ
jgi:hypothetical protein